MHFSTIAVAAGLCTVAVASPFSFPLPNGFPAPKPAALAKIQQQAGGTLPNGALPTSLKADAIQSLQVIAVNEIFEVAYFTSLLRNVTGGVKGYTEVGNKTLVIEYLKQIRAQEELHAIGANAILASAKAPTINPCKYQFPVTDFESAIALAATFTDLVLGTLQVVQMGFALDGGAAASALVPLIGSIIGQEGEQDGAYRLLQKKVPSASPFLTVGGGTFAFNAVAQMFIVPGSCGPEVAKIGIPTYETLTPLTVPGPKNGTATFTSSDTNATSAANTITYLSGQNAPVTVPITGVATKDGATTFKADFPFASGFSKGLTVAALTKGKGPFADSAAVAAATVAGPGLIEID